MVSESDGRAAKPLKLKNRDPIYGYGLPTALIWKDRFRSLCNMPPNANVESHPVMLVLMGYDLTLGEKQHFACLDECLNCQEKGITVQWRSRVMKVLERQWSLRSPLNRAGSAPNARWHCHGSPEDDLRVFKFPRPAWITFDHRLKLAADPNNTGVPFRFMDLPQEIRDQIVSFCVTDEGPYFITSTPPRHCIPLMLTSKQLFSEMHSVFLRSGIFHFAQNLSPKLLQQLARPGSHSLALPNFWCLKAIIIDVAFVDDGHINSTTPYLPVHRALKTLQKDLRAFSGTDIRVRFNYLIQCRYLFTSDFQINALLLDWKLITGLQLGKFEVVVYPRVEDIVWWFPILVS
ncbi:hypothetical protein MMC09_001130 [Bachmanniomyces sp. S44760]|nr:hypothetical protein [Bachmanniomyces sp. S44760]